MLLPVVITVVVVLVWIRTLYVAYRDIKDPARRMVTASVLFLCLIGTNWYLSSRDYSLDFLPSSPPPTAQRKTEQPPEPEAEPVEEVPPKKCEPKTGTARLFGSRKVGSSPNDTATFRVRGKRIDQVTFYTDSRRKKVDRNHPFVFKTKAKSLKTKSGRRFGKHSVKAVTVFIKCTKPQKRILRTKVNRLKPPPPPPVVTTPVASIPSYTAPQVAPPSAPSVEQPQPQIQPAPTPKPKSPSTGGTSSPQPDPAPTGGTGPQPDPYPGGGAKAP